ncbi:MAG TPA: hypothetical protein VN081_02390 [Dongiaceae bacterium]|nr:hypothetical protein [Dongiaceae bacterium]
MENDISDRAREAAANFGGWDDFRTGQFDEHKLVQAFAAFERDILAGQSVGDGGQDRKFAFRNGQFVNRVSGEPIPNDEPIIIFRARDRHAEHVLREYLSMATDEHHREAIRDRMSEFAAYRAAHPERIKEPGITHEITLNSAATPAPSDRGEG